MREMVDLPAPDGPTMATIFPGGNLEAHILQDRSVRVIGEGDILELDLAFADAQRLGAFLVDDLGRLVQQREHRLDIDQALLDLAIDHAHEIERQIELHEDRVDHHEVADGEHPARDIARREQHADDRAQREDHRLPGIQHAERGIGADRRPLVAGHRGIEAPRLELLIAEIFHRLVVEQAVDRLRMRLGVGFVHVAADGDAPLAGPEGEPDIDADGEQHDHHVDPAEIPGDQARDHRELDRRGDRVQHRHAHDSVDAVDAALDDAAQASGPALQMKAQRKLMQMPEGAVGELAHGVLGNHGEPHVAELREQHHQHAAHAIGDDQHGRDGGEARAPRARRFRPRSPRR